MPPRIAFLRYSIFATQFNYTAATWVPVFVGKRPLSSAHAYLSTRWSA